MTAARRRYSRWYICILLLCFCHHKICAIDASDAQPKQRENSLAEDDLKPRKLIMRGQNSQPADRAMNTDKMTAKQIAKMNRANRKRMQMMARRKKKESIERNKMRTNRGRIKPQYDWQLNANPTPKKGQPSDMDKDRYGPPPVNADGPPPPMRPPPPMWEGTGYRPPPPPPPPLDRPPPPPHDDMMEPSSASGSKASKVDGNGSGNKPPIMPGKPPYKPFPPSGKPYPPNYPPGRPIWSPTYTPTAESSNLSTVRITIGGMMNTYGLMRPTSREEYDAMVKVLAQTIMDTSRAPLKNNQRIIQVNVLEIEGITPQSGDSSRQLQSIDVASLGGNSFQCAFEERIQCCARDPPQGAGNPAQYCDSLGCNINGCRRVRFEIIAEQLLEPGSNQSITDPSTQFIVTELYNTITNYLIQQIESEAFTDSLRANVRYCNALCLNTMLDVTATDAVFAPPTDILIAIPTPVPTRFPTKNPTPPTRRPTPRPIPTPKPTEDPTYYPTHEPTLYPTRNPTLFPTTEPPTQFPTYPPTSNPMAPTLYPTQYPTDEPTLHPTMEPTRYPSPAPTLQPTPSPTLSPSRDPTEAPTLYPTRSPTLEPTIGVPPTVSPTQSPTLTPSRSPTERPTQSPTLSPTLAPTVSPTINPTESPTLSPTL